MPTEKLEKLALDFLSQLPPKPSQAKEIVENEKLRESSVQMRKESTRSLRSESTN
jgi:hypothetical protein